MTTIAPVPSPYHERQRLQRCLQHTLNNLLQRAAVSSGDLDGLANELAPGRALQPLFHPHRSLFLGNWDVNVLELALRRHGKELQWHDVRDSRFERLDLDACFGIILNVRADGVVARALGGRHWVALRRIGGRWWNLDSCLPAPELVTACIVGSADSGLAGLGSSAPAASLAAPAAAAGAAEAQAAGAAAGGEATSGSCSGEPPTAAAAGEAGTAASTDEERASAGEAAAVRRFLAAAVLERDAKVFRVVDSSLLSHPLPPEETAFRAGTSADVKT